MTATIHLTHAERASWRLRVQSFDRSGKRIGTAFDVEDGTTVFNKEVKDIEVDMDATSAPYVARVNVAVQMLNAGDNWVTKASNETNLNLHDDQVTLLGDGLDVGGPGFGAMGLLTPATISWKIGDDGNLTATYCGVMYHDDLAALRPCRAALPLLDGNPGRRAQRARSIARATTASTPIRTRWPPRRPRLRTVWRSRCRAGTAAGGTSTRRASPSPSNRQPGGGTSDSVRMCRPTP